LGKKFQSLVTFLSENGMPTPFFISKWNYYLLEFALTAWLGKQTTKQKKRSNQTLGHVKI
jgi:hypothetical protein